MPVLPTPATTIRLVADGDTLHAVIDDPAAAPDTRYAIYLNRNGERIATRGYAPEREARFAGPHAHGSYTATAFCHDVAADSRRKALSAPVALARPPLPPQRRSSDIPPAVTVESIDHLHAALRPDRIQRLDVPFGRLTYNLLTGKQRPGRLYVLLRGAEPDRHTVQLPRFSRFSWRERFPGTVLCIADPTLYLDDELKLGWYFGAPDHDVVEHLARILEVVCARLGLPVSDVVLYGSSGGGFAALQIAARLGRGATAVGINPQTDVLKYTVPRSVEAFLRVCTGGLTKERAWRRFGPRISALQAWQVDPAGEARCLIVQNIVDREHYNGHFRPFADLFALPDNGRSPDGRMASIVYDHPSGHAAEPDELVPRIIETALALTWQPGASARPADPAPPAPVPAPVSAPVPVAAPPAGGRRRIAVAPLAGKPPLRGGPIRLAQLYLPTTATRPGSRPGTIAYRPRADVPPVEVELPLDWSLDPFKDRNWNAQLHMWRLGDWELHEGERLKDPARLAFFVRIMLDWHRYHVVDGHASIYAWQDMMVGIRAMKLAFILSQWQHGRLALAPDELAVLHDLVETHLGFLLDPAEVRYSNHTLSDLHGALALARVVDAATRQRIETFVGEIFPKVLDGQFDAEGIHREHSIGYHRYGINYLQRLIDTGWFEAYGLREVVARAEATLNWFLLPDGRLAPIGDTDGAAPPAAPGTPVFQGRNEAFARSGYVVLRDDGGGSTAAASYLFFMGAYHSRFHKQADCLSLLWYHGEDILCDAGKYAYKTDDNARYAVSRRAHNTVEIDQPVGLQLPPAPYGSAVRGVQAFDGGHAIAAAVDFANLGVRHARWCLASPDGWLLVVDRLEGEARHDYVQWWHLAPAIQELTERDGGLEARLPSGRNLVMRCAHERSTRIERLRGAEKPRRQGWISQAYRKLEPNWAIGMRQTARSAWFATLFAVDAPSSTLSADGHGATFTLAGGTRAPARYRVAFTPDGCRVERDAPPR